MERRVCLVLEFNCLESEREGDATPASLWLVPHSLAGDPHDLDHHKPASTLIVGPAALRLAEQVRRSLAEALTRLGVMVEQETTADD